LGSEQAPLADLKTESQEVRDMLGLWIKNQVWKYGVDGLRIDAAINVPAEFFTGFMEDAGVFATSEVYTRQEKLACEWTDTIGSILNYPLYWPLTEAFQAEEGSMQNLADMVASIAATCKDPTVMGTFSEVSYPFLAKSQRLNQLTLLQNHDVARFRNHTADLARARNVATYLLTADGIPVVYYGIEQHLGGNVEPYFNRQALWEDGFSQDASIYKLFGTLNLFRRFMGRQYPDYLTTLSKDIGIDANTIAWAKGADSDPKVITVLSNKGQDASDYSIELCDGHGYSAGDELLDVVACKSTTVGDNGCLTVWVTDGEPVVMAKKTALEGSTLCGVPGDSKVVLEEQAIISTTWTSMVSGSPSVFHSATTVPWKDAPASITSATSTAVAAKATSTGGVSATQPQSFSLILSLAIIPALILSSSLAISLDRFLR
jgi:alpha-amylase